MTLKRVLRYGAVVLAALAIAQAVRVGGGLSNDVEIDFRLPDGDTVVTIRTMDGEFIRRTELSGPPNVVILKLPNGTYAADIAPKGRKDVRRSFVVEGDTRISLNY